jgi:lactoylglutathione lyase
LGIEHIGLWVRDLEAMRDFYEGAFGGAAGPLYENHDSGFSSYFITFDGGARLELMNRSDLDATLEPGILFGWGHVAFSLPSDSIVTELTDRLGQAGCTVASAPRRTGDGYFESVVLDPEGNRIELVAK